MAEMSLICGDIQRPNALEKLPQEVHDLIFQHARSPQLNSAPC